MVQHVRNGAFVGLENQSDCEENTNNLPPTTTQLHYSRHSGRSLLSNQGAVRGNHNGNIVLNQYNLIGE